MSRAVALSLSPTEVFDAEQEKTLRQFAIAAGVSLVAHALVLLMLVGPNYEEARLAGGGAAFGLAGGGLGEGTGAAPPSEADAIEKNAEEALPQSSETVPREGQDSPESRSKAITPQSMAGRQPPRTEVQATKLTAKTAEPREVSDRPKAKAMKNAEAKASRRSDGSAGRRSPSATQPNAGAAPSDATSTANVASQGKSNSGTGPGSGSAQKGPGSAATSNYTGIETAHIRRKRRSNAAGAGSAILKLRIAANGRLETVGVYRSSGSTRFDRQAMRMAKMASPYPKPPAGQGPVLVRIKGS